MIKLILILKYQGESGPGLSFQLFIVMVIVYNYIALIGTLKIKRL